MLTVSASGRPAAQLRICLLYDRVFPQTIGGVERWMRELAIRLARGGHEVTYLTLRHGPKGDEASAIPGVRVIAFGPRMKAYTRTRRSILPAVVFGAHVFRHLLVRGRSYDVVHAASFPYFPLLAAGLLRRRGGYRLVVDWHEVWTRTYWRRYVGRLGGTIGWRLQRMCARLPQAAFCVSRLHRERLAAAGLRGDATLLPGIYAGPTEPAPAAAVEPLVVYAGRHVPEKRVRSLVPAFAIAQRSHPELRCEIYGDGPERPEVERLVRAHALEHVVAVKGAAPTDDVERALARAACLVTASEREGYGLVVVEAAARGTPSVVVAGPENAAVEIVSEGENGTVALSAEPYDLAAAMLRVYRAGPALRASTAAWFANNASRLTIDESLALVLRAYRAPHE